MPLTLKAGEKKILTLTEAYYGPGTEIDALCMLFHLILVTTSRRRYECDL